MDIIASHLSGLVEQLEAEAAALAGWPRDSVQRAIICHHVADLLGLSHGYALLSARGALAIDDGLARMEHQARRWRWGARGAGRVALGQRLAQFGGAVRAIDAARCAGLLMAYRLVATPGLGGEAARRLDGEMLARLNAVQATRGQTDRSARHGLFAAHQDWAASAFGDAVAAAVEALQWPYKAKALQSVVDALLIPTRAFDRAERRGFVRVEAELRASKRLPRGFAANPAQAFFELQRASADRRRRAGGDDHLAPDEAVRIAA